ncbi:MAG TPA: undecaprenyl-phosphate glucose phosphotransferase [Stellaceae bacterium]|nr:undecaprenyl-phosphate glucose phosphotransferase [Stellaceae bacterium]
MAQLSLSDTTPLGSGRRTRPGSRVARHEVLALSTGLLRALDIVSVPLAGLITYIVRYQTFAVEFRHGLILILGVVVVANVMMILDAYDLADLRNWRRQTLKVVGGWGVSIAILLAIAFFDKISLQYSRLWIGSWFLLGTAFSGASRAALAAYIGRRRRCGTLSLNVAIVGLEPFAQQVMKQITWPGDLEVRVIGIFAPRLSAVGTGVASDATVAGLLRLARKMHIDEIIVHLPERRDAEFSAVLRKLGELPVNVNLCPDLSDLPIPPRKLTVLQETFMINVFERPLAGWAAVLKRVEDVTLSALLLLLFAPLMLLLGLLVRLDSRGPALFRQQRFGFNNNPITVLKFRTMRVDAGNDQNVPQARRGDPRVTRIGRFLRRTSLDELPQLINVLKGDMSLIGPRPHAIAHNEYYAELIDGYLRRHRVKPGITGWAQVNGWRGETADVAAMHERVKHDLYYIENWSLRLDIAILLRTLLVGFIHRNAY